MRVRSRRGDLDVRPEGCCQCGEIAQGRAAIHRRSAESPRTGLSTSRGVLVPIGVLRRRVSAALDDPRIGAFIGCDDGLEAEVDAPLVTEVEDVSDPLARFETQTL